MPLSLRELLDSAGTPFAVSEFASGDVLFHQGDDCDDAWCIEAGRVRLVVTSQSGQEAVSGLLGAGCLVGDCLQPGLREFAHTAVAIEPTVALRVPRERMRVALATQAALLDHVLRQLIGQSLDLEDALVHQIVCQGEERLAHTLLLLAQCSGSTGRCLLPHLSQEIIAEMIGTTRSRVSFFMSRFKKIGFLETQNGEIYVHPGLLARAVHHDVAGKSVPLAARHQ